MLITFRSPATESITMFHDIALELIKMMGATGRIPSALDADEVPLAAKRLRAALQAIPTVPQQDEGDDGEDDKAQPVVGLRMRAVPLLDLLDRAAAKHAEVMWEMR